jgi:hypothetical protein
MGEAIIGDIPNKTGSLLRAIHRRLGAVDAPTLMKPSPGSQLWKQFYHLLYWLDHWLVDPLSFAPPSLHEAHFMQPDAASPNAPTKAQPLGYLEVIGSRIERHLADITTHELERQSEVRGQTRSRLDMMLGQFTHVSHHIGYMCATVRAETGKSR